MPEGPKRGQLSRGPGMPGKHGTEQPPFGTLQLEREVRFPNAPATTGRFYLDTRPDRDSYCHVQNGLGCGESNWPRGER